MVLASRPLFAYVILPAWPGPLSLLSRGGGDTSTPYWIRAWASPNKRVAIEKQVHTIYGQDKGPIFSLLSKWIAISRVKRVLYKSVLFSQLALSLLAIANALSGM